MQSSLMLTHSKFKRTELKIQIEDKFYLAKTARKEFTKFKVGHTTPE